MTCKECEEMERKNMLGEELAYLRVGNANVLICACNKHFNELRNKMMGTDEQREVVRFGSEATDE